MLRLYSDFSFFFFSLLFLNTIRTNGTELAFLTYIFFAFVVRRMYVSYCPSFGT